MGKERRPVWGPGTNYARAQRVVLALRKTVDHHALGFERSLGLYLLEQWDDRVYLTDTQMDVIEPIIAKYLQQPPPVRTKPLSRPRLRKKKKILTTSI
jgi:hypothetical protein